MSFVAARASTDDASASSTRMNMSDNLRRADVISDPDIDMMVLSNLGAESGGNCELHHSNIAQ
jgi:hypothetical protein